MGKDYGQAIPYDPLFKGPLEVSRRKTDSAAFKFFLAIIGAWFIIGIYAFSLTPSSNRQKLSIDEDVLKEAGHVLSKSKLFVVAFTIGAGFLSVVYILMMRWWAKLMAYMIIFFIWICMLGAIILLSVDKAKNESSVAGIVILSIILVVTVILVVMFRKKIAISCAMIQEATKTAMFFPSHFWFPLITCPLILLSIGCYGFIAYKLAVHDDGSLTGLTLLLQFYNFGALLLAISFMNGLVLMIMSKNFATWYFTINKEYVPYNTVSHSVRTVFRYHLGTVAFGSMVITVCEMIKAILKNIAQKAGASGDDAARSMLQIFACCCEGFMSYIEYVSRNAYVMAAIHGTDFLTSAKDAFNLIMRNVGKVIVTTEISGLLFGVGVLISSLIPAIFAASQVHSLNDQVKLIIGTVVFFISIFVSASIFAILQSAVDTIFICVIEDYERNDGSDQRPYYMNYKLRNLMLNE